MNKNDGSIVDPMDFSGQLLIGDAMEHFHSIIEMAKKSDLNLNETQISLAKQIVQSYLTTITLTNELSSLLKNNDETQMLMFALRSSWDYIENQADNSSSAYLPSRVC